MDFQLLATLRDRPAYERWAHFVKPQALTADAWSVLSALGEWWEGQPETTLVLDVGAFSAWYALVRHAKMDKDKAAVHRTLIEKMGRWEVQAGEMEPLLQGLIRRDYASRIAESALRIADGDYNVKMETLEDLVEEYKREAKLGASMEQKMGAFTADRLKAVAGPGLNWRMEGLNENAGPVRQGDLVVFAKRPDSGGTTWTASEATFMAEQLQEPDDVVVWFNNEEAGDKVRRRIVQSALGWDGEKMEDGLDEAMEEYAARMGHPDRIIVYDNSKLSMKEADRVLRDLRPKLIVFDQLWKVKGGPQMEGVEQMTYLFNWARETAKEYAPVIAIHQLGQEGENKKYPGMDALYGTKTGGPGEADLIINMGRVHSDGNIRYFWTPKNKMLTPGNPNSRNRKWEALIEQNIARFKEPRA